MTRSGAADYDRRIDPRTVRLFAIGDLLAILGFVALGQLSHGADPLSSPGVVADAVFPFLLGWAVTATLAGAYSTNARSSVRRTLVPTVVAWLGADLLAQGLRATPLFGGNASVTFFLVAAAVGLVLLALVRAVALAAR